MADVTTLRTLCRRGAPQDTVLYDIAHSLLMLITESKVHITLSPDTVGVNEQGDVVLAHPAQTQRGVPAEAPDLSFSSPEVIFHGGQAAETDHLFSLGLLMAWMKSGLNLYAQAPGGVKSYLYTQLDSRTLSRGASLTARSASDDAAALVSDPALSTIIRGLTDTTPSLRFNGVRALLEHLVKYMPGEATIHFVCNGRLVATRQETLRMNIDDLLQGQPIIGADGNKYQAASLVSIPYRPGSHTYTITVWPMGQVQAVRNVYVKFAGPGDPALLFSFHEVGKQVQFQRSLLRRQSVTVLTMDVGADGQTIPAATLRLTLPASTAGKNGLLTFTCLAEGRVGVTLADDQGVHLLPSDTVLTLGLPE